MCFKSPNQTRAFQSSVSLQELHPDAFGQMFKATMTAFTWRHWKLVQVEWLKQIYGR